MDNSRIITSATQTSHGFSEYQGYLIGLWTKLYNREPSTEAKELMFKTLTDYYHNNQSMSDVLNDFKETIGPDTAINWYTQESFIYRLVNNAFRTRDWNLVEKLRYFVGCLHMQLTREHRSFVERYHDNPSITVYRGQLTSKTEFKRLVVQNGKTVFLTSLTSTSFQEHIAMNFIKRCQPSHNEMCVLFKITIDTHLQGTQPYADISHLSAHPDEEEVLIMLGATFRVTNVLLNTYKKIPVVLLELCSNRQDYDINHDDEDSIETNRNLNVMVEHAVSSIAKQQGITDLCKQHEHPTLGKGTFGTNFSLRLA